MVENCFLTFGPTRLQVDKSVPNIARNSLIEFFSLFDIGTKQTVIAFIKFKFKVKKCKYKKTAGL